MSVGFLTWLAAARLYPASQVGIAASAISAMMLCGVVGILGIDMALVVLFPEHRDRPARLINTAITIAMIASCVCALVFVGIAAAGLRALHVLGSNPVDTALFVVLTVLCGAWWMMDQTSVALRHSGQVLVRALVDGTLTITGVAVLGAVGPKTAGSILAAWVAAAVVALSMGYAQINRAVGDYKFRPRMSRKLSRQLIRIGLPNSALTAADMAPGLILPIVAAAALSTRAAAYWYAAWMMAFAAYQISWSFGLHLFAEIAGDEAEIGRHSRQSLRSGLAVSAAATVVLVSVGPLVLRILGSAYASHGTNALRLAALAAIPMCVVKSYLFACRALNRLTEGTLAASLTGALALGLAIPGAYAFGLSGIAGAWLATQVLGAVWAGWRLRNFVGPIRSRPRAPRRPRSSLSATEFAGPRPRPLDDGEAG